MNRFDYLSPSQEPVVEGLEGSEKIYALEQPEFLPIRTLPGAQGLSAIYRCELTESQRAMIAEGADILIEIFHGRGPLAPSRVMLLNQKDLAPEYKGHLAVWMRDQLQLPE